MIGNMTVMQYASKFAKLSRFIPYFIASKKMKIKRFEDGLVFYIRNQLAERPI